MDRTASGNECSSWSTAKNTFTFSELSFGGNEKSAKKVGNCPPRNTAKKKKSMANKRLDTMIMGWRTAHASKLSRFLAKRYDKMKREPCMNLARINSVECL